MPQTSRTALRRFLIAVAPSRCPRWLPARAVWRAYSLTEWLALRFQDLALAIEDEAGRGR